MKDFTLKRGAIVVFLTIMSVSLASGQTDRVYVSTDGSGFSAIGDHDSWENATDDLQEAINALYLSGGGEIWVESGMYWPTQSYDGSGTDRSRSFIMREGVSVIGGFAGTETSLEQRTDYWYDYSNSNVTAQSNATVLSGNFGSDVYAYHVVYASGISDNFVALSDVIIRDGIADGSGVDSRGGGIQTREGGVYNNVVIYNCRANKGGAVYAYRGGIFNGCHFTRNQTREDGDFEPSGTALGGAIYMHLDGGEVNNCFVYDNYTHGSGGGICTTGGVITNSRFVINEANSKGAGVYSYGDVDGSVPTSGGVYKNCLMASNTSWVDGGGVFATDTGTWVNCTVVSNRATDGGGGVYSGAKATFTNLSIWGNYSPNGGDNIVSSPGGFFNHLIVDSTETAVLPGDNNIHISSHNIGTDVIGPHFVAPTTADPGRGTTSAERNANLAADWSLQIGSPMLNAGTPDVSGLELGDYDVNEGTRIVQDTVDVGAYELLYYVITSNVPDNGEVAIAASDKVLPEGSATVSLTPDENFQLVSFTVNGSDRMEDLLETDGVYSLELTGINENQALEVNFASLNEYTMTVTGNAGGEVSPRGATIAYEGQDFSVEITPAYGFKVIQILLDDVDVTGDLSEDPEGLSYTVSNVMGSHTIDISFAPYYVVTVTGSVGGDVTPLGENELFTGDDLEVLITPALDYMVAVADLDDLSVLDQLVDNGDGSFSYTVADVGANAALNIEFSMFNIVSSTVEAGGAISHPGDTEVPVGGDLELVITPDEGFKLTSLLLDDLESIGDVVDNLDGTYSFVLSNVTADAEVVASFTAFYVVSVTTTGGGEVTPDGDNDVFTGEDLTLTIDPGTSTMVSAVSLNGANIYNNLVDNEDGTFGYTIEGITEAFAFDVVFTPLYTISTSSSSGGAVSPDGGSLVASGENLNVTITPEPGYKLTLLLVDGASVLSPDGFNPDGSYTYVFSNVNKDFVLEAGFSPYYIVQVSESEGGNVDQAGTNDIIQGSDLELDIEPDPGYEVVSVYLYNIYRTIEEELVDLLVDNGDGTWSYTIEGVTEHLTLDVEFGLAASVGGASADALVSVSPNPVENVLYISGDVKFAQLLNINGVIVAQFTAQELKSQINVGHLANGLYILRFEDGRGESGFIKIIIKH